MLKRLMAAAGLLAMILFPGRAAIFGPSSASAQQMVLVQFYVSTEFIGCEHDCCWTNYCCSAYLIGCTPVIRAD